MIKIIVLILGLAIGFGGGVWWGQKNPEAAAKLSAEEERRVLEAKIQLTEKFRQKLDQLTSKSSAPASGFVGAGQSGPDVNQLKAETAKEEAELKQQLEKVK
jgi:hypothetical protein